MLNLSVIAQNNAQIKDFLHKMLQNMGFNQGVVDFLAGFVMVLFVAIISLLSAYVLQQILRSVLQKSGVTLRNFLAQALVTNKFHYYVAWLLPYVIISNSRSVFETIFAKDIVVVFDKLLYVMLVYTIIRIVLAFVNAAFDSLRNLPSYHDKPINSYRQVFKIFIIIFGIMVVFSILTGQSPYKFFAAMGAASAILLLMFKDVIMGFVASVQVTTNDMVRIGDWITMPKYGADGDVIEITLTTVKIQNFDKTISTIPTYALISDSFQNWRGIISAGGRRIKRALFIKQNSIRFIKDDELERFRKIERLQTYIDEKRIEIDAYNEKIGANKDVLLNGRNLTNVGLFRKYIEIYLTHHAGINQDMILMVRQLAPTETGMPLEIYAFTSTTKWVKYEYIMADIIDHIVASVVYFDLQIFERASNSDIQHLILNNRE